MLAYFDNRGVCVMVTDRHQPGLSGLRVDTVPDGTRVAEVYYSSEGEVQFSQPTTLSLPTSVNLGSPPAKFALAEGVVAEVNGVRQERELVLPADTVGTLYVDLKGAQHGSFTVEVTSYQERRKALYPSVQDQLDAIWKGGVEMERMRARINEIKQSEPPDPPGKLPRK